mmetsp:Transcript_3334/g.7692  ORF Transcript_3334/g.7692 Transcript_3334/m.7692 type:complete len:289 (+) Transcript_3334:187-1053(+)
MPVQLGRFEHIEDGGGLVAHSVPGADGPALGGAGLHQVHPERAALLQRLHLLGADFGPVFCRLVFGRALVLAFRAAAADLASAASGGFAELLGELDEGLGEVVRILHELKRSPPLPQRHGRRKLGEKSQKLREVDGAVSGLVHQIKHLSHESRVRVPKHLVVKRGEAGQELRPVEGAVPGQVQVLEKLRQNLHANRVEVLGGLGYDALDFGGAEPSVLLVPAHVHRRGRDHRRQKRRQHQSTDRRHEAKVNDRRLSQQFNTHTKSAVSKKHKRGESMKLEHARDRMRK